MLGVFCKSYIFLTHSYLMHDQHEVRYQVPDTLLLIRGSLQAVQGTAGDDFVHACGREDFDTFILLTFS